MIDDFRELDDDTVYQFQMIWRGDVIAAGKEEGSVIKGLLLVEFFGLYNTTFVVHLGSQVIGTFKLGGGSD